MGVKDYSDDHKKNYEVDATLCWGPLIFGMMLGGALGGGRGGPVMAPPGMRPYLNTAVPGLRRPGTMPAMMSPRMPGMGVGGPGTAIGGPGMPVLRRPGQGPRYPMY